MRCYYRDDTETDWRKGYFTGRTDRGGYFRTAPLGEHAIMLDGPLSVEFAPSGIVFVSGTRSG